MSASGKRNSADCLVRQVAIDDLGELVELFVEHAQYEGAAFDPDGVADRLLDALWTQPVRLHAWVATSGAGLMGYAAATAEFSTWMARDYLHMDCLFVRDGWRGAGIGTALLAAVIEHACDSGYLVLQWQTPAWNKDAARFYRRNGAVEKIKRRYLLDVRTYHPFR